MKPQALTGDLIRALEESALKAVASAGNAEDLETLRVEYLGRKGRMRQAMSGMGQADPAERPTLGALLNQTKQKITAAIDAREQQADTSKTSAPAAPKFDITLPGRRPQLGRLHPILKTLDDLIRIFAKLGFEVVYGPEVELEYYNFDALNTPADHPAREASDTFYLHDDVLLRTQTSTVQIRVMEKRQPPIRIVAPGKVYRPETVDATHGVLFHQIEGLAVDQGVSMGDLKYTLQEFARGLFGSKVKIRFRPHFFPFTEPSVEVDLSCHVCGGKGCALCKQSGWIEMLGAGMVDPNVFQYVGYDAEKYTGFAFGLGVDRIAMARYGIDDLRLFLQNDLRFLAQF